MTKQEVQKRVLQNGEMLPLDKFEWDEKTNTFSSNEDSLVLDFKDIDDCTFKTGSDCIFDTWSNCTFDTGSYCTFDTWSNCTFDTGSYCTFNVEFNCTFKTEDNCTFDTGSDCTFKTGDRCVVVRRDIYEIIETEKDKKIKLNSWNTKGFTYVDEENDKEVLSRIKEIKDELKELKNKIK